MTTRDFDPRRLDVARFAKQAGRLEGAWPVGTLERLAESASPESPPGPTDEAAWSAVGESRRLGGTPLQPWLHLRGRAPISLVCQRCLGTVAVALEFERSFTFVAGEDEAARLDEESEDDVLALTATLDLRPLVEDELLLAMPLVPRHEVCSAPLKAPAEIGDESPAPNPFAALAALKRGPLPN